MFPNKYLRYGAIVILGFMGAVVLIGCSSKLQPKGWLSVEKAPIRVILVDNEKDINQATVNMIIRQVSRVHYENYQFTPTIGVSVTTDHSALKEDHASRSLEVK